MLHGNNVKIITQDIKDLYYSLDPVLLATRLRNAIETNYTKIAHITKLSPSSIMELLILYLKSTVIHHNNALQIQARGICIGSQLAPSIVDIYLNEFDLSLDAECKANPDILHVYRYVDDIIKICTQKIPREAVINSTKIFAPELIFTNNQDEITTEYLDLVPIQGQKGLCWIYGKSSPSKKRPLKNRETISS